MKGYQMYCKGVSLNFSEKKTIFNGKIYLRKESITEEKIQAFMDVCADGGGIYDMDKSTIIIKIAEVLVIE